MPKISDERREQIDKLMAKIVQIKDSGLLPKGYAKTVAEELEVKTSKVYDVANGRHYNPEVAEMLLNMAGESKLQQLIKKADDILGE